LKHCFALPHFVEDFLSCIGISLPLRLTLLNYLNFKGIRVFINF
jgi:hypothetical protein